jgi:hypothetical protein
MLAESLIIAYSTPNYTLSNHFLKSLNDIGVNSSNISHFIEDILPLHHENCAFSNFWYLCKKNKLNNLIQKLKENKNNKKYKYFISSDCDIWFIKDNVKEWNNLQKYIDNTNNDIFFMREGTLLYVNCGFFIIKNNSNLINIISFLDKMYQIMMTTDTKDMMLLHPSVINKYKSEVNFGYIPNEYVIWATDIFDQTRSLFHHPVCCSNQDEKRSQISYVSYKIFKNNNKVFKNNDKTYNIIIAKYNENLEWINYLDKSNIIIYDKSNNPIENSISRPNIGRDPETFLYHIIKNYDNLPDYLIFLQGEPFGHFTYHDINKENLQNKIDELINSNLTSVSPLFTNLFKENIDFYESFHSNDYFLYLFNEDPPKKLTFSSGCQYIVSKENILSKPKEFYQYVRSMIYNNISCNAYIAHFGETRFDSEYMSLWSMERFLFYIINKNYTISNKVKTKLLNVSYNNDYEIKNKVVVTPAGRKKYLEILLKYLVKAKNENQFDRWDLWLNTNVEDDIEYCKNLSKSYEWINIVKLNNKLLNDNSGYKMTNIYKFFKFANNINTIYVRLDDDIVYLEPKFLQKMFKFRLENPEPFIIYGNIINNAVVSHFHQKNNLLDINYPSTVTCECFDYTGTCDYKFCELIHSKFIDDIKHNKIHKWYNSFHNLNTNRKRVSVNCVSWFGKTFDDLGDVIYSNENIDEEQWLSVEAPKKYNKYNLIYNEGLVAHLAFFTQREQLEGKTNILQKYKELSEII